MKKSFVRNIVIAGTVTAVLIIDLLMLGKLSLNKFQAACEKVVNLQETGQTERAAEKAVSLLNNRWYAFAMNISPEDKAMLLAAAAQQCFQEESYETAEDYYSTAVRLDSGNSDYPLNLALVYVKLGETEQAQDQLEKADELGADEIAVSIIQGEILCREGENTAALEQYETLLTEDLSDTLYLQILHSMSEIYINELQNGQEDNLDQAVQRQKELLSREEDSTAGDWLNLAIMLEMQKNYTEAIETLQEAAGLFPSDYRLPAREGLIEVEKQEQYTDRSKDYSNAETCFNTAEKLYSNQELRSSLNLTEEQETMGESDLSLLREEIESLRSAGWLS